MDMILRKGRPEDEEGRLKKELRSYDFLDSLGIEYYTMDNPHADTMEDCAAIEKTLGAPICKNLFLCNRQKTAFYLLMIPATKVFKTKDISAQINSARLSFGSGEDMEALLDITPGSLSVLGLINDKENKVRLLVDADVLKDEYIGIHPCVNTSSMKLKRDDIFERFVPATAHTVTLVTLPSYDEDIL